MNTINFKTVKVDGLDIFYREAGNKNKPTILLLHGFPSSSHMYRDLIKDLSEDYYLVAPDYPGFGQSSSPSPSAFNYSFDNLVLIITHFKSITLLCYALSISQYNHAFVKMIKDDHKKRKEKTAASAIKTYHFLTRKYGRELLLDIGRIESLKDFIIDDTPHNISFYEILF